MLEKKILIELGLPYFHHHREWIHGIYDYALRNCPDWTFVSDPYDFYQSFQLPFKQADGVFIRSVERSDDVELLERSGVPVVNLALPDVELPFPVVTGDDAAVGRVAARVVAEANAVHTLYVGPEHRRSHLRCEGFVAGLGAREMAPPRLLFDGRSHDSGIFLRHLRQALEAAVRDGAGKVGVYAFSDSFANAVVQTARALEIKVPRDLVVLGTDNDELICDLSRPPLTSIPVNSRLIGFTAARQLHRLMNGESVEPLVLLPPEHPVERLSTETLSSDDPVIAAAMSMMHKYVYRGIQVAEIVRDLPISRRTFEKKFRQATGRSPYEHIQQMRLNKALRMLQSGKYSNIEIAEACGYSSAQHFEQGMRLHLGKSPNVFRPGR